jgi:hypothetical protein
MDTNRHEFGNRGKDRNPDREPTLRSSSFVSIRVHSWFNDPVFRS